MNTSANICKLARNVSLVILLASLTACATHEIDWSARVGSYTFDQAVLDLGVPTKQATLHDGTVVAEWMVQRGFVDAVYAPYYGYGRRHHFGPMLASPIVTSTPDIFVRLTFGPDGILKAAKKVTL
jgi:hypothetical protein